MLIPTELLLQEGTLSAGKPSLLRRATYLSSVPWETFFIYYYTGQSACLPSVLKRDRLREKANGLLGWAAGVCQVAWIGELECVFPWILKETVNGRSSPLLTYRDKITMSNILEVKETSPIEHEQEGSWGSKREAMLSHNTCHQSPRGFCTRIHLG